MTEKETPETKEPEVVKEEAASEVVASEPTTVNDQVTARLKELGVQDDVIEKIKTDFGAETVEALSTLEEEDLTEYGMKKGPARMLLKELALPGTDAAGPAAAATATPNAVNAVTFDAVLPSVPTDDSWLEALRTGGVLKIDQSSVISAIRAGLAHKAGLFSIPKTLVELMERFADESEEQVDAEYFELRQQMTRRSYADIFSAIKGLDGTYVTEARKKRLFERIDTSLWPSIISFNEQLKSWQESWLQGVANPAVAMNAALAALGSGGGVMPPGMMQPPDTGILRDYADAVADAINKVFAGTGVQIAAALAYDASKIKETLTNSRLPTLIGAANRDQMLRQLGVAVSATYPRLETNLTRFVLAVMQVKDQPAGNEELQYFSALFMLGSQIPWDQLEGENSTKKNGSISNGLSGIGANIVENNSEEL
ncbi:hypothetical protein CL633_04065 [bacterium]|nr:hypothetical protein [bacterium]|tara:strand:- start:9072 stop:10352 length:1281 start_codon:yes stop_codon:yes gene_type:complete